MSEKQAVILKNSDVRNKDTRNSDVDLTNFRKLKHGVTLCYSIVLLGEWHIDNNILTQGTDGAICQPPDVRKEAGAMVTYSDLIQFVIMLCVVITLVIYYTRKK